MPENTGQVPATRFVMASARIPVNPSIEKTQILSDSSLQLEPMKIPAAGYSRCLELIVETSTNGTASAAPTAGVSPSKLIAEVKVLEAGGNVLNTYTGEELEFLAKYMGVSYGNLTGLIDLKRDPDYAVSSLTTDISTSFKLYVPLEVDKFTALGAFQNGQGDLEYQIQITLAARTAFWAGGTITLMPTLRLRVQNHTYAGVSATTGEIPNVQAPLANGTVFTFHRAHFDVSAGQREFKSERVGRFIRALGLRYQNATPADLTQLGAASSWPDRLEIKYNGTPIVQQYRTSYVNELSRVTGWGQNGEALDAAGGLNTGLQWFYFDDPQPRATTKHDWSQLLPTDQGTRLTVEGNFGVAGHLYIYTCDVAPLGAIWE